MARRARPVRRAFSSLAARRPCFITLADRTAIARLRASAGSDDAAAGWSWRTTCLRRPLRASARERRHLMKKARIVDLCDEEFRHIGARDEPGGPVARIDQHTICARARSVGQDGRTNNCQSSRLRRMLLGGPFASNAISETGCRACSSRASASSPPPASLCRRRICATITGTTIPAISLSGGPVRFCFSPVTL